MEGTPPFLICISESLRSFRASPRQGVLPREYDMEEHGLEGLPKEVCWCPVRSRVWRRVGLEPPWPPAKSCEALPALFISCFDGLRNWSLLSPQTSVMEMLSIVSKLIGAQKLERLRDEHCAARSSNCIAAALYTSDLRAQGSVRRLNTTKTTSRYGSLY